MSLEKPWERPFEKLLGEFSQQYEGEISRPKSEGACPSWGTDPSFLFYPTFSSELKGQKFIIEISEFPASDISYFEASDNVEYLRIFIVKPTQYSIVVTHEDWLHWLEKKIHLDREFQTNNDEFDRRYYVSPKSDEDKQLLMDLKFQQMVRSLEPFSLLQVSKSGVRRSQMITDEEQLDFSAVDGCLKKTLELAKLISTE